MTQESNQQILESLECDQLLLHVSPLLGENFDPSEFSEKVRSLNGKQVETPSVKFPMSIGQKSGNIVEGGTS